MSAYYQQQQPPAYDAKVQFSWIGESFQLVLSSAGTWIGSVFLVFLITIAVSVCSEMATGVWSAMMAHATSGSTDPFYMYRLPGYWLSSAITTVLSAYLYAGMFQMANAMVRGQAISIGMLFGGGGAFLPFLGFQILYGLACAVGFVLLVLPFFVVMGMLFPAYAMVADGVSISDAMNRSFSAMAKEWFMVGLLMFTVMLIMLLGCIPCFLGLFLTMPMWVIMSSLMYRDMVGMPAGPGQDGMMYGTPQPGSWPPPPSATNPTWNPGPNNPPSTGYPSQWPSGSTPPQSGGDGTTNPDPPR
jgi:hypothetical protein